MIGLARRQRPVDTVPAARPRAVLLACVEHASVDDRRASRCSPPCVARGDILDHDQTKRPDTAVTLLVASGRKHVAVEAGQVLCEARLAPLDIDYLEDPEPSLDVRQDVG